MVSLGNMIHIPFVKTDAMSARYIENEIPDFGANPKKARKGKSRKGNGVEDAILHSALRLSLQRILRETSPSEVIRSRDFSVYTGVCQCFTHVDVLLSVRVDVYILFFHARGSWFVD